MKLAVKGLNSELGPIDRSGPKPAMDPLPMDLIAEAEEYSPPETEGPPETEIRLLERPNLAELVDEKLKYLEKRRQKEFRRSEKAAAEGAMKKILGSGRCGVASRKSRRASGRKAIRAAP